MADSEADIAARNHVLLYLILLFPHTHRSPLSRSCIQEPTTDKERAGSSIAVSSQTVSRDGKRYSPFRLAGCAWREKAYSSCERATGFDSGERASWDFLSLRVKIGGWCRDRTHAARRLTRFSGPGHYFSANHPCKLACRAVAARRRLAARLGLAPRQAA